MAPHAARLLARSWHRAQRRWWRTSAASLALVLVAILLVSGLFAGMQQATRQRVGDFYTSDLRITQASTSVAPDQVWTGTGLAAAQQALGPAAHPRLEMELILSRRSLVAAYLDEHNQYEVATGGSETEATTHYGLGIVAGIDADDPIRDRMAAHLVTGSLPRNTTGAIQLTMGKDAFWNFLSASERANLSAWPPLASELAAFRFEATSGYVDTSGLFKDLVRHNAVVVGLFDTGLDALDGLTVVADLDGARQLAAPPFARANVFTVGGAPQEVATAQEAATRQGWRVEGAAPFADRYLGQLLAAVRALSLLSTSLFLAVPAFLVWHGLQQLLDRQRREIAVCRAIGVGHQDVDGALARLAVRVVAIGLACAAVLALAMVAVLPRLFATWQPLALPLDFRLDATIAWVEVALAVLSAAVSLVLAARRSHREAVPAALRAA